MAIRLVTSFVAGALARFRIQQSILHDYLHLARRLEFDHKCCCWGATAFNQFHVFIPTYIFVLVLDFAFLDVNEFEQR
jgi:hypothetical protein